SFVRVRLGLNGLGDAEVGDDVVGVIGRARQRRVRADEGLAGALIGLDPDARDGDSGRRALERLLVDGDGGDGARLQVHLALKADTERAGGLGERQVDAGREAGARVDLRLVGDDAAADLL